MYKGYKDKEKRKSYMRMYMRDRRAEEKARQEAEEKNRKLRVIEDLLVDYYVWTGQKEEFKVTEPKITRHPIIMRHAYDPSETGVKVSAIRKKPVIDKKTGKQLGTITYEEELHGTYEDPEPAGYMTVTEGVPDDLKLTVRRVRENAKTQGINVNDIYIKRDVVTFLKKSFTELLGDAYHWKMSAIGKFMIKNQDKKLQREWLKLLELQKESEEALEDFIIRRIVEHETDEEILRKAHADEKASTFFSRHWLAELAAKKLIEEIRGDLPSFKKKK